MPIIPDDTFLTISAPSEGIYKDKGSKFLAFAYPVVTEVEVKDCISDLKKQYYDARHHCYAYVLGKDKSKFRANDDGEPSSSAGKPILGQIYAADLSNILVVVVRYFGGKKLGVGGLIIAYRTATYNALANAKIIPCILKQELLISCSFADVNKVMKLVKQYNLEVINYEYTPTDVKVILRIRENLLNEIKGQLKFASIKNLKT